MQSFRIFFVSFVFAFLVLAVSAFAQSVPLKYFSAVSTNSTLVFGSRAFFGGGIVTNTTSTIYYLKLYNKATAPTCGTDVPVWTIAIPANLSTPLPAVAAGLNFGNGLGFCITGGIADNDNTNAATGIVVNLAVSGR